MLDVFLVHAVPAIIAGVWNLICMGLDRLGVGRGLPRGNRDGVGLALGAAATFASGLVAGFWLDGLRQGLESVRLGTIRDQPLPNHPEARLGRDG